MHLILTYLSVIMMLGYFTGAKAQDSSNICTQGRIHKNYLTFGVGRSDNIVLKLKTQSSFNCAMNFATKAKNYIILVLQFPNLKPKERVCVSREASNNLVTVSDFDAGKNCQYTGSEPIYRSLSLEKASVQLKTSRNIIAIEIIATSMRVLASKELECLKANETTCSISEKVFCMTKSIACDENINCGVFALFDEDISECKGKPLTFLMKLSSFLMGILTVFLFGSTCLTVLPKRKETFVYKAEETIPSCDSESEIISVEVDVQILFSDFVK